MTDKENRIIALLTYAAGGSLYLPEEQLRPEFIESLVLEISDDSYGGRVLKAVRVEDGI